MIFDSRQILGVGKVNGKEVVVIIGYSHKKLKLDGFFDKNVPMLELIEQHPIKPNQFLDSLNISLFIPSNFYFGLIICSKFPSFNLIF